LTYHELQKLEYITGKGGNTQAKVQSLVDMGNSLLLKSGIIHHKEGKVWLEEFNLTEEHGASYKMVSGDKIQRSVLTATGYTYKRNSFEALKGLLSNDTAYCPFMFRDGIRGNDYVEGGATFIVLDVDTTDETADEMHDNLDGIMHHIARTSDSSNPYKYRILLASDVEINVSQREWKPLIKLVSESIGVKTADLLPMSQIYYGYKGREVLSCLDGEKLNVSDMIKNIPAITQSSEPLAPLSQRERTAMIGDAFNTFQYAYNASVGTGSISLYRAYKHMADLGFTYEEVMHVINDIVFEYWETPMDSDRFEKTIHTQIKRHYGVV